MSEKIKELLRLAEEKEELFRSQTEARNHYRRLHPLQIACGICSDGRLNPRILTGAPLGIIDPYRSIGAKFDLKAGNFQHAIQHWKEAARTTGADCLFISTYHYAKGEDHRGCLGQGYNTERAIKSAMALKTSLDRVYAGQKTDSNMLFTLVFGIETDGGSLLLHPENGGPPIDVASLPVDMSDIAISALLVELYPYIADKALNVLRDLAPLIKGNIAHVASIKGTKNPEDGVHKEWVVAIGRGFPWLYTDIAMIVGLWEMDITASIHVAATIVERNMLAGVFKGDPVLLTSAVYDGTDFSRRFAKLKSLGLFEIGSKVIREQFPELPTRIRSLMTIFNPSTFQVKVFDENDMN